MKCPYILKEISVEEIVNEFDENSDPVAGTSKFIKNEIPMECMKEDCAAWQDGKCARHS